MTSRPDFIKHWMLLEDRPHVYPGDDEPMAFDAPIGERLGLTRIGIHHVRIPPGHRTSYPHAESAEEEFVFVLSGRPDVWIDGVLYPLETGDSVGLPAGTGICHAILNNTTSEVRLLVVGEKPKSENRICYPLNEAYEATREDRWLDAPKHPMGPHDGIARAGSKQPLKMGTHMVEMFREIGGDDLEDVRDRTPGEPIDFGPEWDTASKA